MDEDGLGYDLRTKKHFTLKERPMIAEDLRDALGQIEGVLADLGARVRR